jgi:hypothetical protein
MDAIETKTVERNGQTFRITIYPDGAPPNPLDDWCEMGRIFSLSPRHANFDPIMVELALDADPDAVKLSYYEHGACRWSVAGELPSHLRCPFDSVSFAGLWLPDAATLASAGDYRGRTRRCFMRQRARQACAAYTAWCNGEVYGFVIDRMVTCPCCGQERADPVDNRWGFYGLVNCLNAATVALAA